MQTPADDAILTHLDPDPPDPRLGETVRVLLVEDSDVDARIVEHTLKVQGCSVLRCSSVEAGVQHLQKSAVDVILLDLGLPDASGLHGVHRMRSAFPHMPVVVVTGSEDPALGPAALQAGAQDYVSKERLDGDQLVRTMRYAMARKQSERLRQRLEHTDRLASLGQLAAGIAHEINNPLAFIMANMEMMQEHLETFAELCDALAQLAPEHRGVARILAESDYARRLAELQEIQTDNQQGAERIRTIVRDLRGFARSESDQLTQVDVNETVMTALNITRNEIRHRARLVTRLGDLPPISGDQARLCQVVVNLLVNSAQAIEEGKADENVIEVSTSVAGNGIALRVSDTGCGVPEAMLPRLFEPFFTTKPRDAGTGLGLALCAETIRRHGGHIDVTSEVGKGTTIEIQLPADHRARRVHPVAPIPRVSLGQGNVLLVDDDSAVRKAFSRTLRRDGYEVTQAASVAEALQILERNHDFDAIVCDLVMPDLDGPDFYKHVNEQFPQLTSRIVFISGGAFTRRTQDFVAATNVTVLAKPPKTNALEEAIRNVKSG